MSNYKNAQSWGAKRIFHIFALFSLLEGEKDRFMINEQTGFELAFTSIFTNVKSNIQKICYLFLWITTTDKYHKSETGHNSR